jgi:hypothetical protein
VSMPCRFSCALGVHLGTQEVNNNTSILWHTTMEVSAAQSGMQAALQYSRRLQPLRFLFLVVIFLQLYLSNSVSLPSICGILLSCVAYTVYVDIKAKRSPDIGPLPSPPALAHALPPLSPAALGPDHEQQSRCGGGGSVDQAPSLPSESSSQKSDPEHASVARESGDVSVPKEPQQQRQQDHQKQQQPSHRAQGLSTSAAPWEPSIARASSASLYTAKSAPTGSSQPPTSTIFVGNMSSVVTENDLLQMFSAFGDIIVARIQRGTKQKGLKMCAFCSLHPCPPPPLVSHPLSISAGSLVSSTSMLWSLLLLPCARCRACLSAAARCVSSSPRCGIHVQQLQWNCKACNAPPRQQLTAPHAGAVRCRRQEAEQHAAQPQQRQLVQRARQRHQLHHVPGGACHMLCGDTCPSSRCLQPHDELEALPSTVPCSMCQLEAAPFVCSSVARCLTCSDTVCVAHLKAHNSIHQGHGHKVFFLSNQNLAQFAQSAADLDSPLHSTAAAIRASAASPDVAAPAPAAYPLASPSHSIDAMQAPATRSPAPPLHWHEPVGYFASSAAAAADMQWAAEYRDHMPWADTAWNGASLGAAAAADESQISPLFVGQRSVHGGDSFSGGLW